ncbi:38685_t:CDS:2, partial [Gigaspora margarita]
QSHGDDLLEEELPDNFNAHCIRFVFPTVIASRYGSSVYTPENYGKKLTPDIIHYTEKTYYYLNLLIESPSHHISTELNIDGNPNISKITLAKLITHFEKRSYTCCLKSGSRSTK